MTYEEVEENSEIGAVDLRRGLIDMKTAYIIMLVSSVLSVGSSYMLVLAVNKVCQKADWLIVSCKYIIEYLWFSSII